MGLCDRMVYDYMDLAVCRRSSASAAELHSVRLVQFVRAVEPASEMDEEIDQRLATCCQFVLNAGRDLVEALTGYDTPLF